ncbi:MAG: hypothetical protein Q8P46_14930 [Hyphomicrobiales bacterium]|nr:hypothetical protein [Hyphomicrobiales bacterium]
MEWVRVSRGVYSQSELVGAAWDPLYLFVLAGVAFVILHALYKAFLRPKPAAAQKD